MIRIVTLLGTVALMGCASLSPAPEPDPEPEPFPDTAVAAAYALIAEADPAELEGAPREWIAYPEPAIEDSWPPGPTPLWAAKWTDPNPGETAGMRWLMLCPGLDSECFPMGWVSRTPRTNPDTQEEEMIYTGFAHIPDRVSPFSGRALLMSADPEAETDSGLSNEVTLVRRISAITPATPVPEPSMAMGLAPGLILLTYLARKRLRRQPWKGI